MALVLKKLWEIGILAGNNFDGLADKRVKDWYLMGTPFFVIFITVFYCVFVFDLGKRFMKNRKPYDLKNVLVVYNLVQVIMCSYLVVSGFSSVMSLNFKCAPVSYSSDPESMHIVYLCWVYFVLKLVDLLDTVFFVLRKKYSQITFLHVYHHALMVLLVWVGLKFLAGGHSIYLGYVNSVVHVVMYLYYLLSAWNDDSKKNLWWKKHITQIQLVQFMALLYIYGPLLLNKDCGYPKSMVAFIIPQNFIMLVLFSNFYYHAYIKKSNNKL